MPLETDGESKTIETKKHDKINRANRGFQFSCIAFLILINFLFRYPFVPHEIGWDSFFVHSMAQSVNDNGMALWTISPLSYFGMYPLSYSSAVPFLLSGISQVANINIETSILVMSIMLGIVSALGMFIFAGIIKKKFIFQFLVALLYSTSGGLLQLSTWTATSRGMMIALIPLFFYLLFSCIKNQSIRMQGLMAGMLIIIMATHRMFILIFPMVIVIPIAHQMMKLKYKAQSRIRFSKRNMLKNISFLTAFSIVSVFVILFLSGFLNNIYDEMMPSTLESNPIKWATRAGVFIGRDIGLISILSLLGFFVILTKNNKDYFDVYMILIFIAFVPLVVIGQYTAQAAIFVFCILAGTFVFRLKTLHFLRIKRINIKRITTLLTTIIIIGSIFLTGYFQAVSLETHSEREIADARYVDLSVYDSAMWLNEYNDGGVIQTSGGGGITGRRVTAIADVPHFPGEQSERLINGYSFKEELAIIYRTPLDYRFYKYGAVEDLNIVHGELSSLANRIGRRSINHYETLWAIDYYNIAYAITNEEAVSMNNQFTASVMSERYCVFHNEKVVIFRL